MASLDMITPVESPADMPSSNEPSASLTFKLDENGDVTSVAIEEYMKNTHILMEQYKTTKDTLTETTKNFNDLVIEVAKLKKQLDSQKSIIKQAQSSIDRINLILKAEAINRVKKAVLPRVKKYWGKFQKYLDNLAKADEEKKKERISHVKNLQIKDTEVSEQKET